MEHVSRNGIYYLYELQIFFSFYATVCWDSVVRIATCCGLDDPGSNPCGKRHFPHPSRPAPWLTKPPIKWVPSLFLGAKRSERDSDHLSASSAEDKERVELIHLCALMVCARVNFTLCNIE